MSIGTSNITPSNRFTLLAAIDPDAYGAGAITAPATYIDMNMYPSVSAILKVGDFVATGKADLKAVQATDAAGTGSKDVTGKAITQLTQAGTDDNKQAIINVSQEDLDLANGFGFVSFTFTLTTAGADADLTILGFDDRYGDANHASTVDEVV